MYDLFHHIQVSLKDLLNCVTYEMFMDIDFFYLTRCNLISQNKHQLICLYIYMCVCPYVQLANH